MTNQTEVRPKAAISPKTKPLPLVVAQFHNLPDEARINSRCLRILLGGIGTTTFFRRRKAGLIPDPDKFNTWSVAQVRAMLSSIKEGA